MFYQPWIPVARQVNFFYVPVIPNEYDLISGIVKVNDQFNPLAFLP
jgi:hypothetical protein